MQFRPPTRQRVVKADLSHRRAVLGPGSVHLTDRQRDVERYLPVPVEQHLVHPVGTDGHKEPPWQVHPVERHPPYLETVEHPEHHGAGQRVTVGLVGDETDERGDRSLPRHVVDLHDEYLPAAQLCDGEDQSQIHPLTVTTTHPFAIRESFEFPCEQPSGTFRRPRDTVGVDDLLPGHRRQLVMLQAQQVTPTRVGVEEPTCRRFYDRHT